MPFDINFSELVVLAILAVVIFGPDKLPELARKAGRVVNYVRNIANDARGHLNEELGVNVTSLNPKEMLTEVVTQVADEETAANLKDVQETVQSLQDVKKNLVLGGSNLRNLGSSLSTLTAAADAAEQSSPAAAEAAEAKTAEAKAVEAPGEAKTAEAPGEAKTAEAPCEASDSVPDEAM